MASVQHVGWSEACDCELFVLALRDFNARPESLSLPGRNFVAFLAADAHGIDTPTLQTFARWLLDAGCVYFCAWGFDCERVHDIFDEECFEIDPVIMTTWHDEETLDEALRFFANSAFPDDGYRQTCGSGLAIIVGNSGWADDITKKLANVHEFNRQFLGDD